MDPVRVDAEPAIEQPVIGLCVEGLHKERGDSADSIRIHRHADGALAVLRMQPPVEIEDDLSFIGRTCLEALVVVTDPPGKPGGQDRLPEHVAANAVNHLAEHNAGLLICVRPRQHLAAAQTVPAGLIALDILHRDGIHAPGVRHHDLAVDAELLVEPFLIPLRALRDVAHREKIILLQPSCLSRPDHPEVDEGAVAPEPVAVGLLIELCDPHAVLIRRRFFCGDIHAHLRQIQICPDPDRCRDAGFL